MILKTFAIVAISGVSALGGGIPHALDVGIPNALDVYPCCPPYGLRVTAREFTDASALDARRGHRRGGSITAPEGFLMELPLTALLDPAPAPTVYSTLVKPEDEEVQEFEPPKMSLRVARELEESKRMGESGFKKPLASHRKPKLVRKGHVGQPKPKGRRTN